MGMALDSCALLSGALLRVPEACVAVAAGADVSTESAAGTDGSGSVDEGIATPDAAGCACEATGSGRWSHAASRTAAQINAPKIIGVDISISLIPMQ
jgi:hypothetical protein